ncbi:MAG TPA: VTT domain-containing protein [Gemmatimonadales bacterium]|nr:VTT domain-containing protein [Gemmatimonadales bacterium]
MGLQHLIVRYGLAAVFLGSGLEGDLSMVLGGVVAHRGYFAPSVAIAAAALGAFIADCVWYAVGRLNTTRLQNAAFYRKVGPRVEAIVRRIGIWQIVAARFVYGTKNATMLFWGLHGLPFHRFVLIDAIGCVLGSTFFVGLGYLVGDGAEVLLGRVKRFEFLLLGGLLAGIVVLVVIRVLEQRRAAPPERVE